MKTYKEVHIGFDTAISSYFQPSYQMLATSINHIDVNELQNFRDTSMLNGWDETRKEDLHVLRSVKGTCKGHLQGFESTAPMLNL